MFYLGFVNPVDARSHQPAELVKQRADLADHRPVGSDALAFCFLSRQVLQEPLPLACVLESALHLHVESNPGSGRDPR